MTQQSEVRGWVGKGFWAVLDQGLFAGSNFLLSILLARWLSAREYGLFTLSYSLFILFANLHAAAITEPMMIFGPGEYRDSFVDYFKVLLKGHWLFTGLLAAILGVIAAGFWFVGAEHTMRSLAWLAVALPFLLFMWLIRRAFYAISKPRFAASLSAVYVLCLLPGLYLLFKLKSLTQAKAFVALGLSGLLASLCFFNNLRNADTRRDPSVDHMGESGSNRHRSDESGVNRTASSFASGVLGHHLKYSRWSILTSVAIWVSGNLHYVALAPRGGLDSVAAMKVIDTLFTTFWQFLAALSSVLLTSLAFRIKKHPESVASYVRKMTLVVIFLCLTFYAAVSLFAGPIIQLVFGAVYVRYAALVPIYGLYLIPESISLVLLLFFRSMIRTDLVFLYHLVLSIGLAIVFAVVAHLGLTGIVWGRVAMSFLVMFTFLVIYFKSIGALKWQTART